MPFCPVGLGLNTTPRQRQRTIDPTLLSSRKSVQSKLLRRSSVVKTSNSQQNHGPQEARRPHPDAHRAVGGDRPTVHVGPGRRSRQGSGAQPSPIARPNVRQGPSQGALVLQEGIGLLDASDEGTCVLNVQLIKFVSACEFFVWAIGVKHKHAFAFNLQTSSLDVHHNRYLAMTSIILRV